MERRNRVDWPLALLEECRGDSNKASPQYSILSTDKKHSSEEVF